MTSNVNIVRKALRDHLVQLVGVQRAVFRQASVAPDPVRDVDLFVHLWSGVVIHIHLIDEPLKANKARRIIENGTSSGIPVLFILDSALLPKPGGRTDADKWFLPFQALTHEHLYSYRVEDGTVSIFPVQFKAVTRLEVETSYGQPVTIMQIRHFRHTVKNPALKGYWLLADLESDIAAESSPFQRASFNTFQSPNGATREMPRMPETGYPPPPKTRLDISYELLGVKRDATREQVKAAFRKLAFEVHPDVSELPKPEAEARFKLLSEAYEYIKTTNDW
jgi:hypothetical protein